MIILIKLPIKQIKAEHADNGYESWQHVFWFRVYKKAICRSIWLAKLLMRPRGVEPRSQEPESHVRSITLRAPNKVI